MQPGELQPIEQDHRKVGRTYAALMLGGAALFELMLVANRGYDRLFAEMVLMHGMAVCLSAIGFLVLRRTNLYRLGGELATCSLAAYLVALTAVKFSVLPTELLVVQMSVAGIWTGFAIVTAALTCRPAVALGVALVAPTGIALAAWTLSDMGTGRMAQRVLSVGTNGLVCATMLFALVFIIAKLRGQHAAATSTARELQLLAQRDGLTGLLNRRGIDAHLTSAMAEVTRSGGSTHSTLTLIDIDRFKRINDEHGHSVGDEVLRQVAAQLLRIRRPGDAAARWGGEEFLLLSNDASQLETLDRIAHLQALMKASTWPAGLAVRASFGVAALRPDESLDDAIERADTALYRAKANGRDRAEVAAG